MVHAIQIKKEIIMNKILNKIVWVIIVVPAIYLVFVYNQMPDRVADHFDIQGNADSYTSKGRFAVFLLVMVAFSAGLYLLLKNIYRIDPRKYAVDNKDRLQRIGFATVVFLSAIGCIVIHTAMSGKFKLDIRYLFALGGLFWAVIGNYLQNIKPNYFAGFRTPWALENPENWRLTHQLAGKLWFAGGLIITVICVLTTTNIAIIAIFTILSVITIIPLVYSYLIYKKQKSANTQTK
jgi:uncharacterized membrane protein